MIGMNVLDEIFDFVRDGLPITEWFSANRSANIVSLRSNVFCLVRDFERSDHIILKKSREFVNQLPIYDI